MRLCPDASMCVDSSFMHDVAVFCQKVDLPPNASMCVDARMTLGMLRSMLRHLRVNLTRLLPYLQIILQRVCAITYDDYIQGHTAWKYRWKELSHKGYDVHKNRWVDYGNAEYASFFGFLYLHDDFLKKYLDYIIEHWPPRRSRNLFGCVSRRSIVCRATTAATSS